MIRHTRNPVIDEQRFFAQFRNFGTHIAGASVFRDPRIEDRSRGTLTLLRYDVNERKMDHKTIDTQADGWPCIPNSFASADGRNFHGVCLTSDETRFCRISISVEGRSFPECSVRDFWPPELVEGVATPGPQNVGVVVAAIEDGYAVIASLPEEESPPRILTLGPATEFYPVWAGTVPRFGGFIAFRHGSEPWRLADVGADGVVQEVIVPANPCIEGAECGKSAELRFLLPLGDDYFLGFYIVNAFNFPSAHEFIYALRFKAERRPFPDAPGRERPLIPGYPTAREAGPMIKACLAARSCGFGVGSLHSCSGLWDRFAPQSKNLLRALEAVSEGCEALREAWPTGLWDLPAGSNCRQGCTGNVFNYCLPYSEGSIFVNCDIYGTTCDPQVGCVDGSSPPGCHRCTSNGNLAECGRQAAGSYIFSCAEQDLMCVEVGGQAICMTEETCTASRCEDGVAWYCFAENNRYIVHHCALMGLDCWHEGEQAGCWPGQTLPGCGSIADWCIGSSAISCVGGVLQVADCQELGFSGCAMKYVGDSRNVVCE
ncbi:MAG: hypothetical protein H0U74_00095 [Bradymonadaceae bacterium]|nr:hypothetical protein [Lujinxingiaceae bacterium]